MALGSCRKSLTHVIQASIPSPIGLLKVTSCEAGLHSIEHDDQFNPNDENFIPNLKWNLKNIDDTHSATTIHLQEVTKWIKNYFQAPHELGKFENFKFCFWDSTDFEQTILMTLYDKTKVGDKITYRELSEKAGRPNASRAVGTAMRRNPFPLLIPCHRVIRSDGNIGNYSGGKRNKIKEFLLNHEQESLGKN